MISAATLGNRASVRYGLAVMGVALAMGLRLGLTVWLGPDLQYFVVCYPMVMAVALVAGFRPGVLATVLSAALVAWVIMPPTGKWAIASPLDPVALVLFVGNGMFMSVVGELFRRRRSKAEAYDREAALRESQERISRAQRAARVGTWDWNVITGEAVWTDEAWEIFGRKPGDFTVSYDHWLACVHPDDRARAAAANLAAHESGKYRDEFRVLDPDGGVRWVDSVGEFVFDDEGKPLRMIGTVRDISERKQVEEALNHSLSLLRATLESTADGLLVIDQAGKITDYNRRFAELWRLPESVLIRGNDSEALELVLDQLREPEDFLDKVKQLYARPEESSSDVLVFKDGRIFERFSQPQLLDDVPVGRVWSFRDISERKRSEEKLKQSEALYRGIGESIDYGVWLCAADGRNTYASESFLKMVGITQEQCSNFGWGDVLHPDDVAGTIAAWQECVRTGSNWDREHRFRNKNGGWHYLLARGVPVRNADGTIVCWAGINLDITGLKQTQEELRASQQRMQLATEATGVGIWEWNVTTQQIRWDSTMFSIYGLTPTADGILPYDAWTSAVLPEDLPEQEAILQETLRRVGRSARNFRIHRADNGQTRDIEAVETVRVNAEGKVEWVVGTNLDITERKQAAAEAARLAAIVKSSDDAIVSKDLHGIVTSWNAGAEKVFGYPAAEMIGQSITRLIPVDRLEEETEISGKIARGEGIGQFETLRIRKNGEVFDVSVTVSPIKNAGGKVSGASKVARDITAHKRAEEELRKLNEELEERVRHRTAEVEAANRELEAFSYSVAHDLRAPLRSIDGFSRAVLQDYGPQLDAEGQEYLQLVREGCQRMGDLISDLLKLSRLTRAPMQRERVDLSALARGIADDLQRLAPERVVEYRIADKLITAGDPTLLEAALRNLIENAWKFTGRRAAAVIEVGVDERSNSRNASHSVPVFFVRDNGAGFDPKYSDKLFGVFQRLHRQEEFAGTGVGLATVQRIIQRHGGRIWAESAEEQGATFYFNLNEKATTP